MRAQTTEKKPQADAVAAELKTIYVQLQETRDQIASARRIRDNGKNEQDVTKKLLIRVQHDLVNAQDILKKTELLIETIEPLKDRLAKTQKIAITEREARRNQIISLHAWRETQRGPFWSKLGKVFSAPKIPEKFVKLATDERFNQCTGDIKFSIITPSFNSAADIERAIKSVLDQNYENFEHIVVDGGSTDETLAILKKYDHLKWISESDRGQVHAMNKGFAMATGDIISYLNADDYYKSGAFQKVAEEFLNDDVKIVFGNVDVYDAVNDSWWTNEPRYDFKSVLYHWEPNAFCVNPVGYFFRREVQETVPIIEDDGAKHDLAFLMGVAQRYENESTKIDRSLGVFINAQDTQTGREQSVETYWSPDNFSFIDRLLTNLSAAEKAAFHKAQLAGYQQRRQSLRESE